MAEGTGEGGKEECDEVEMGDGESRVMKERWKEETEEVGREE